ncbi:MAG TPA: hypothetical protein VHM20_06440, partial [Gammaproteobacteria bacterium]|nr:hypothetical protein [Gammaproteobacteria bacterium]
MLRDNDEKKASDLKEEGIPSSASEIARAPRLPSELDGINISKALSFITEEKLPQSKTTVGLTDSAIAFYAISLKYQRGMELIKQYINDEKIKQNFSFELDEVISDWNNFIKRYLPLDFRKNLLNKVLDENKSSTDTQVSEIKKSATDEVEINEPQIEEKNPFIRAANKVKNKNIDNEKLFAKTTRKLELMFAKIVFTNLNKKFHHIDFSHAHKQVTMASDIAILLEKHAMIHSHYDIEKEEKKPISSTAVALSIEPSGEHKGEEKKLDKTKVITVTEDTTLLHLRPNLYDKYLNFETEPGQKWLRSTLKFAGFDANAKGTWLENLFRDPKTQAKLKEAGVPATSSSRWLFLPGNARTHEIKIT